MAVRSPAARASASTEQIGALHSSAPSRKCGLAGSTIAAAPGSRMFAGIEDERFYFVHSYAARDWVLPESTRMAPPLVTWTAYQDDRFVSAVENGPLWATQFHPEKSGDAGAALLRNWLATL